MEIASAIPMMSIMPTIAQSVHAVNNTQVPIRQEGSLDNGVAAVGSASNSGSAVSAGSSDSSFSATA